MRGGADSLVGMHGRKSFWEIDAADLDKVDLRAEMEARGYVLIRGLLTGDELKPLLADVTGVMAEAGWLQAGTDPVDRMAEMGARCAEGDGSARFKAVYDAVFGLPSFHRLPHHPAVAAMMKRLVGEELLVHPKSAARLIFPDYEQGIIHAHQDHTSIAGDPTSYTVWAPLHDCPVEEGALRVLEGSHRFGLLPTVGQTGCVDLESMPACVWAEGAIGAGDVLVFHSLTVHEAAPNRSERLRISLDCRFQNYGLGVNPEVLVFPGSGRRSWEKTYAGWESDELKFYWTRMPLVLKPTREELRELAGSAESLEMRARYGRVLERIEEQGLGA
jgi:ectoine hydroxylase-related dioxygenase (phytanoyl-CoA dioxygenase family)